MIDEGDAVARYLKVTVTGTEKAGMFAAIWNVKVFDELFDIPPLNRKPVKQSPANATAKGLLVDFDASRLRSGVAGNLNNKGALGGSFHLTGRATVSKTEGVKAVNLDGKSYYTLSVDAPQSLDWNSSFTVSAWVYKPEVTLGDCIITWNSRENMLQSSYAALMYGNGNFGAVAHGDGAVDLSYQTIPAAKTWHHILVTFDGMKDRVYVDGKLDREMPIMLFVEAGKILIGASGLETENFKGSISRVMLFDKAMDENEVQNLFIKTKPKGLK